MWQDFGDYILSEAKGRQIKIAEIAVGKYDKIANRLEKEENITIIKTDIMPKDSTVIMDDITNPNLELYEGTDLIYSIRPPSELQPYIVDLALRIGSQLIIKPLTNEDLNTGKVKMKLKNFGRASFYTLR
ncbi:MAG: UPF0146 family protein [Methanobrevibacter sp.]|nr:UPF0146 family protein [Methanobrevibacter sp.]